MKKIILIGFIISLILLGGCIEPQEENIKQEKLNIEFEEETIAPETFYEEVEIGPNRVYYWAFDEETQEIRKIDFDIQSDSGVNIYFIKSKEDYEIYSRRVDRSREKFQFYKDCKKTGTQSFKGTCNVGTGGLMIGNTQSDPAKVKINLTINWSF